MVDSQSIKRNLRSAFASQDPYNVAQAVDLPTISPQKATTTSSGPTKYQLESFMVDGIDCGGILLGLLNASEAAEAVRILCVCVCVSNSCINSI